MLTGPTREGISTNALGMLGETGQRREQANTPLSSYHDLLRPMETEGASSVLKLNHKFTDL
jgi:hypothetical protein